MLIALAAIGGPRDALAEHPDQVAAHADWILSMQVGSGPDKGLIRANAAQNCVPYFANIAASGLAAAAAKTGDARYAQGAWNWLEWYAAHMDSNGFVANYRFDGTRWTSTGTMDSTDGYAATYLIALRDAYVATADLARLTALWPSVSRAVSAIVATDNGAWLTFAKPGYPHAFLMDNVEVYEAFRAVEHLAGDVVSDAPLRHQAGRWTAAMPAALERYWNPARGGYDIAVSDRGVRYLVDWNTLYPGVTAQAWMVRTGLVGPTRARELMDRVEQTHPTWDRSGTQAGDAWWPEIVESMRVAGMSPRAEQGLTTMLGLSAGRAWPYQVGTAGRLIREMIGAPDTLVTLAAPAFVKPGSVTVAFTGVPDLATGGPVAFECALDFGPFAPCASPATMTAASEGAHRVAVRAIDTAGNRDPTPAVLPWTVDATGPVTRFVATPAEPGNAAPVFAFEASDATPSSLLVFECAVAAAPFGPCANPARPSITGTGTHTFSVRAIDPAGNTGDPATFTWFADATPPTTRLLEGPSGVSASGASHLVFDGADDSGSVRFECRLNSAPFSACVSPVDLTVDEGTWVFQVRAVDEVGNPDPAPATRVWYVDRTPPATVLLEAPAVWSRVQTARFSFMGLDNIGASWLLYYECSLDGGPFARCAAPTTYNGLAPGSHTFEVRTVDGAGLPDPTPERFTWTVDVGPPSGTIVTPDNGVVATVPGLLERGVRGSAIDDRSGVDLVLATFTPLDALGAPTTVAARLDCGADTSSCSWIADAPAKSGRYRVAVKIRDRAGNEAAPAPAAITVHAL